MAARPCPGASLFATNVLVSRRSCAPPRLSPREAEPRRRAPRSTAQVQFTDVGLRASDNYHVSYGASTARIAHISDIFVDGVSRATPGSSDETAEASVWIAHPVMSGDDFSTGNDFSALAVSAVPISYEHY